METICKDSSFTSNSSVEIDEDIPFEEIQILLDSQASYMNYQWSLWLPIANLERHSSNERLIVTIQVELDDSDRRIPYLNLSLISWERKRGWKLSESTPLFQSRILLAEKIVKRDKS